MRRNYGGGRDSSGGGWITIILFLIAAAIGLGRGAFADQGVAVRALEAQGFSNIEIVDHVWFAIGLRGCDGNDAARFTARATNPTGRQVEVFVCTGLFFKGGTIRVA